MTCSGKTARCKEVLAKHISCCHCLQLQCQCVCVCVVRRYALELSHPIVASATAAAVASPPTVVAAAAVVAVAWAADS